MRQSSKASLCGIISALAVVIMLSTYISPFLVYTAPAFSGLLLLITYNELGLKWSFVTYISISLLSLFVIADKESAIFFTLLFGYFPTFSCAVTKAVKNKINSFVAKLIMFNVACLLSLILSAFVIGVDSESIFNEGLLYLIIFALLLNVLFVVYDILILRLQLLYLTKFQKKFRRIFKINRKG